MLFVESGELVEWKSVPSPVSCSFGILRANKLPIVWHLIADQTLYAICTGTEDNITCSPMAKERSPRDKNLLEEVF